MKKIVFTILAICLAFVLIFIIRFSGAFTQEGNPIPIITAILQLELKDSDYESIEKQGERTRFISKHSGNNPYMVIEDYMSHLGWTFEEQMGSGFIFRKGEEMTVIETRLFSRYYFIWDVSPEL